MNPASTSRTGVDPKGKQTEPDAAPANTPRTDMQDVDAGTPASGNGSRATAAESVMKQEQKTEHESGSRR